MIIASLMLTVMLCGVSCEERLLTGTPEWLGSSIYEELESSGNFTTTLALINDSDLAETNYPELLRRTGSLTLFVASDSAWAAYLAKRSVTSVGQLPRAEKKNLLKASMVNNAYLIELLSNDVGPVEGSCLQRASRLDINDSIPIVRRESYPEYNTHRLDNAGNVIDYWAAVRNRESIKIYKDNTAAPMVHFLPDYMKLNDFTTEDLLILSNGAESDAANASYINGKKVIKKDITCQNGYIHVLADVLEPLNNMAEVVNTKPQFSIFSSLLERFSYPQFLALQSVDGVTDSLFVKRYFNNGGSNHGLSHVTETDVTVSDLLSLDPGWNELDAAAFLVPCNEAMCQYISPSGDGSAIGEKYDHDWNNVPDNVVLPFINNCLRSSLVTTIPSKFEYVTNTASERMGIKPSDVDSCFLACNGVIYQLKRPFIAPEHQSVLFPAMLRADDDVSITYRMITDKRYSDASSITPNWTLNEYQTYLNSMACTFSFLSPVDVAYASYIDPYSIYELNPIGYKFYIDPSNAFYPVCAKAFKAVQQSDGSYVLTDQAAVGSSLVSLGLVNNRLQDLLENMIVVHGQKGYTPFHVGQDIYLNKAGSPVEVQFEGTQVVGIAGSAAMEENRYIPVQKEDITDMTKGGNGMTYVIGELPVTTRTSPYKLLTDTLNHPAYTTFTQLLLGSSFLGDEVDSHPSMDKAISLLGNFNYTIYVPQSTSIDALIEQGKLPTWYLYDEWDEYPVLMTEYADAHPGSYTEAQLDSIALLADSCKDVIRNTIEDFIRYHIQDGSVYLGGADTVFASESALVDPALYRFRRLNVSNTAAGYTVTDLTGHVVHVLHGADSNQPTRQYLFTKSTRYIYNSSYAAIQLIDDVLTYDENQYLDPATFPKIHYPEGVSPAHGPRMPEQRFSRGKSVHSAWKPQHSPDYAQDSRNILTLK